MAVPLIELKGTWKEIEAQIPDFRDQRLHVIVLPDNDLSSDATAAQSPLDVALADIWGSVPNASWDQLPADFSENLDHYLYGTPKRK